MPLQATSGAASYDAFGGGTATVNYIEDVFSTWLYTGNGSSQTITNGINLSGRGGMVWSKTRSNGGNNVIIDSARSASYVIFPNDTAASGFVGNTFLSNGVILGDFYGGTPTIATWTFRKQPKFFDVVTFTANSSGGATFNHSLDSVPGCVIIKCTSSASGWFVYHRSTGTSQASTLNNTDPFGSTGSPWITVSSTSATVASSWLVANETHVAYIFAHDAGGFGLTNTDNVISCGSYTGNGSATGPVVSLGYEPQWLMVKNATGTGNWQIIDNMRGMSVGSADATVQANLTNAESSVDYVSPTATGFRVVSTATEVNTNASTYIYIAIRRGPMRTPASGTSVFAPLTLTNSTGTTNTTGFPVDLQIERLRTLSNDTVAVDRLRGVSTTTTQGERVLRTNLVDAEIAGTTTTRAWDNTGFQTASGYTGNSAIYWNFRRAPSFFDVVCWTGVVTTVSHGLGVIPELVITKSRSAVGNWDVQSIQAGSSNYQLLRLETTDAKLFDVTAPTSTVFSPFTSSSGVTYVTYLFASCPGVSKVGTYTGNGSSQTINCGFTAGARFMMVKRTDSTGDWYVWDTARGIVSGNDPRLSLNSTATEVTTDDSVDTDNTGFVVNQLAATNINVTSATYIFLAIA